MEITLLTRFFFFQKDIRKKKTQNLSHKNESSKNERKQHQQQTKS